MLRRVVSLVLTTLELLEVEAALARRHAARLGFTLALLLVLAALAAALAVAGAGLITWSAFLWLDARLPTGAAALLLGLLVWALVAVLALVAWRRVGAS